MGNVQACLRPSVLDESGEGKPGKQAAKPSKERQQQAQQRRQAAVVVDGDAAARGSSTPKAAAAAAVANTSQLSCGEAAGAAVDSSALDCQPYEQEQQLQPPPALSQFAIEAPPLDCLAPEALPGAGGAYNAYLLGPPAPPCEDERLVAVQPFIKYGTENPPDPEVQHILNLVQGIFKAPEVLVALFDDKRISIINSAGKFERGDFPWRWTFCAWSMAPKGNQTMVIEDSMEDARFRDNVFVQNAPGVRFYCGTPLLASNGHRLGVLCFADLKPRKFDAASCLLLSNMAELVSRSLERDIALELQQRKSSQLQKVYNHLTRSLESLDTCILLVDAAQPGCKIMYANWAWTKLTGIDRDNIVGETLGSLFKRKRPVQRVDENQATAGGSSDPHEEDPVTWPAADAFAGGDIVDSSGRVNPLKEIVLEDLLLRQAGNGRELVLKLRPASEEVLDEFATGVGAPSFIASSSYDGSDTRSDNGSTTAASAAMDAASTAQRSSGSSGLCKRVELDAQSSIADGDVRRRSQDCGPAGPRPGSVTATAAGAGAATAPTTAATAPNGRMAMHSSYFFVTVQAASAAAAAVAALAAGATRRSSRLSRSSSDSRPPPSLANSAVAGMYADDPQFFKGLKLGPLLGTGASGRVYRANWYNTEVAVKVTENSTAGQYKCGTDGSSYEAILSRHLCHPNIVRTMQYTVVRSSPPATKAPVGYDSYESNVQHDSAGNHASGATTQPHTPRSGPWGSCLVRPSESSVDSWGGEPATRRALNDIREDDGCPSPAQHPAAVEAVDPTAAVPTAPPTPTEAALDSAQHCPLLTPPLTRAPSSAAAMSSFVIFDMGCDTELDTGTPQLSPVVNGETWMVMEYCDKGCLRDAVDRGWLRMSRSNAKGVPNMEAILATAQEIAAAMSYLHDEDCIHGDLSAFNILLSSAGNKTAVGGRGFVAKVADFGLSRSLDVTSRINTNSYGTVTHMPPELIRDGLLTKAADVYAFGVLLWEMYHMCKPWAGLRHAQIVQKVVTDGANLQFSLGTPVWVSELGHACMHHDPSQRPTFEGILRTLGEVDSSQCSD